MYDGCVFTVSLIEDSLLNMAVIADFLLTLTRNSSDTKVFAELSSYLRIGTIVKSFFFILASSLRLKG